MRLFCRCGKRKVYAVATIGTSRGTGEELRKGYGPFNTRNAAAQLAHGGVVRMRGLR